MSKNLIARVKHNLQAYEAAKDAWIADKKNDADIHDNYVFARDMVEMGAHEDESELLAAIERLQAENARLRDVIREFLFWSDDAIDGAIDR